MIKHAKNIIVINIVLIIVISLIFLKHFGKSNDIFISNAVVKEVIDGDTIRLADGSLIRYIGVNTPEIREKVNNKWKYKPYRFSEEAKAYNKSLVLGKNVRLQYDIQKKDKFNRILCYVYLDDIMVNTKILEEGYGIISLRPPNLKYVDLFVKSQEKAINNKKGLWKDNSKVISPRQAKPYIGRIARVRGQIKDITGNDDVAVLAFKGGGLFLVVFIPNIRLFEEENILMNSLVGKTIEAYGIIKEYNNNLEIIIDHPCQLKIIE